MTPPLNVPAPKSPFDTVGRILDSANLSAVSPKGTSGKEDVNEPPKAFSGVLGKAIASHREPANKEIRSKGEKERIDRNKPVQETPSNSSEADTTTTEVKSSTDANINLPEETKQSEASQTESDIPVFTSLSGLPTLLVTLPELTPVSAVLASPTLGFEASPTLGAVQERSDLPLPTNLDSAQTIDAQTAVQTEQEIPGEAFVETAFLPPEEAAVSNAVPLSDLLQTGSSQVHVGITETKGSEVPEVLASVRDAFSAEVTPFPSKEGDLLPSLQNQDLSLPLPGQPEKAKNASSQENFGQQDSNGSALKGSISLDAAITPAASGHETHESFASVLQVDAKDESTDSSGELSVRADAATSGVTAFNPDLATLSDPSLVPSGVEAVSGASPVSTASAAGGKDIATALPRFEGSITDQVVQGASLSVQNGRKEITLQLNPENMGQLRIHLSSLGDNQISARLIADSLETHKELQAQMDSLKTALETQGLQVQRITVVHAGSNMNAGTQDQSFSDTRQNAFQQLTNQQASQQYQPDTKGQQTSGNAGHPGGGAVNAIEESEAVGSPAARNADPLNPRGRISLLI